MYLTVVFFIVRYWITFVIKKCVVPFQFSCPTRFVVTGNRPRLFSPNAPVSFLEQFLEGGGVPGDSMDVPRGRFPTEGGGSRGPVVGSVHRGSGTAFLLLWQHRHGVYGRAVGRCQRRDCSHTFLWKYVDFVFSCVRKSKLDERVMQQWLYIHKRWRNL